MTNTTQTTDPVSQAINTALAACRKAGMATLRDLPEGVAPSSAHRDRGGAGPVIGYTRRHRRAADNTGTLLLSFGKVQPQGVYDTGAIRAAGAAAVAAMRAAGCAIVWDGTAGCMIRLTVG